MRAHCDCGSPNPWQGGGICRAKRSALDDPSPGFNDEAFGMIGAFDDLDHQPGHCTSDPCTEHWTGIGAVGKQRAQEGELPEQGGQQQHTAVAILHIGSSHQHVHYETQRIDQDMPLLALDQLARIEPVWIDPRPPFSALFTLWLSTMQAVGLASRIACSRHFT